MPFNGSGGFQSLASPIYPAVDGTPILSDQYNLSLADVFLGLGNTITRDGQSPPTQDLPMNNHRHLGALAAAAPGQYLVYGQAAAALADLNVTGTFTAANAPFVSKSGDTMTGTLTAPGFVGPVTGASSLNVLKAGDTMSGSLTLSSNASQLNLRGDTSSITNHTNAANSLSYGQERFDSTGYLLSVLGASKLSFLTANGGKGAFAAAAYVVPSVVPFSAALSLNAALSNVFFIGALTSNITAISFTGIGMSLGQSIEIYVQQDAVGNRTVAGPNLSKITGAAGTLPNQRSVLTLTNFAGTIVGSWTSFPA